MSKKLIGVVFGLLLGIMVLPQSAAATPPPLPQKLTQAQIQSIIGLLQSFGAEQSVINKVAVTLGGSAAPAQPGVCVNLSRDLTIGANSDQVRMLQRYLKTKGFFEGEPTGYYGFITAQSVGKLQASLGIVSSPQDRAYGMMGPRTRAALMVGCEGGQESPAGAIFSATPTTGVAPLKVQFTSIYYSTHDASESQYYVNFGDGTKDLERITCIKSNNASDLGSYRCLQWGVSHVYNSGTYTAELIKKVGSQATVLSTLPIVVSGDTQTNNPSTTSFSATPTTGVAPLTISFKVPYRSAGGDYFSFGDGTTGCAVPGTTNDYMTGCLVPINQTFTHTYTQPGTYTVVHSRLGPSTVLGTATITVAQN